MCSRLGVTTDIHDNFLVDFGTYLDTLPSTVYNYQKVYLQTKQQCTPKVSRLTDKLSDQTYGTVIGINNNDQFRDCPFLPWRWLNVDWSDSSSSVANNVSGVCAMNPWDLNFCHLSSIQARQQKQQTFDKKKLTLLETSIANMEGVHILENDNSVATDDADSSQEMERVRLQVSS